MEIAGILWLLRRCRYAYHARVRLPAAAADVAMFAKLIGTLPYFVLTQLYLFVLDAGLSRLAQGSFAVFRYASTIASRSQGVFLRPVSVTFFTEFSESQARATGAGTALTDQAMARVLAISALVATGVLCGAGPVLRGLWEGEQFPAEQIISLVWLLGGLYVLLPVVGSATILRKVAVSMGQIQRTYLMLAVVQVLSAALAWQVVPLTGLSGALFVSAFNLVGFCIAPLIALRVSGRSMELQYPFGRAWRWLLAAAAGVLVAGLIQPLFPSGGTSMTGRLVYLLTGGALAAIGMVVAFGSSWALRIPESRLLASRISRALTP
jgi:peptidoglycan biosynthesis protein MviN/MurJ (putative lipid II flippase)